MFEVLVSCFFFLVVSVFSFFFSCSKECFLSFSWILLLFVGLKCACFLFLLISFFYEFPPQLLLAYRLMNMACSVSSGWLSLLIPVGSMSSESKCVEWLIKFVNTRWLDVPRIKDNAQKSPIGWSPGQVSLTSAQHDLGNYDRPTNHPSDGQTWSLES